MMMDLARLHEILAATTSPFRKGDVYEGTPALVEAAKAGEKLTGGGVLEIYAMPHEAEARADLVKVDCVFIVVGVDKPAAEQRKDELVAILQNYPEPPRLAQGSSYIEIGAWIGSQDAALRLFALGEVLGLWRVITPALFGMSGDEAREAAGVGFIMVSGFPAGAVTRQPEPTPP
jgi:hypothetical protein